MKNANLLHQAMQKSEDNNNNNNKQKGKSKQTNKKFK